MRRQQRVAAAGGQALESDGVGSGGMDAAPGEPTRPVLGHPRHSALGAGVGGTFLEESPPAGADQHDVARADRRTLSLLGVLEVRDGDLVATFQLDRVSCSRDVEEDAAAHHRLDGVHAELDVLATGARRGGVLPAVQEPVLGDVGQRVDVGADVGAHRDHVVGRAGAVGAGHVPVPTWQRVPELRVVGGLGHPDAQLAPEVDDPDSGAHGCHQLIAHWTLPLCLKVSISSTV